MGGTVIGTIIIGRVPTKREQPRLTDEFCTLDRGTMNTTTIPPVRYIPPKPAGTSLNASTITSTISWHLSTPVNAPILDSPHQFLTTRPRSGYNPRPIRWTPLGCHQLHFMLAFGHSINRPPTIDFHVALSERTRRVFLAVGFRSSVPITQIRHRRQSTIGCASVRL